MLELKFYKPEDYPELKKLYEEFGWFDAETDSEEKVTRQIINHPDSILIAYMDNKVMGTVTLLFTERLGLFFRLITDHRDVREELLKRGEEIFKEKGYNEVHVLAQEVNLTQHKANEEYGFTKGRLFRWFWKKI